MAKRMNINPKFAYQIGAIAIDVASFGGGATGTSLSWATHTITGSNPILVIGVWTNAARTITGTWNTTEATTELANSGTVNRSYLHYVANPTTGNHTIALTVTGGSVFIGGLAASYTGVAQSTPLTGTNVQTTGTAQTESNTVTIANANSWAIGLFAENNAGTNQSAGSGTFQRKYDPNNLNGGIYDSNTATSAATYTLNATTSNGGPYAWVSICAAMSPFGATPPVTPTVRRRMLMGIGQ